MSHNMGSTLLAQWHIQCVRERLENDVEKADYIHNVNSFVRRIWVKKVKKVEKDEKGVSKAQKSPSMHPTLEVADVENSTMTYRGATTDVIKVGQRIIHKYCNTSPANFCDRSNSSSLLPTRTTMRSTRPSAISAQEFSSSRGKARFPPKYPRSPTIRFSVLNH